MWPFCLLFFIFFFFNDTATTEIYTLSLHDALPISFPIPLTVPEVRRLLGRLLFPLSHSAPAVLAWSDRKSTRLNSSHLVISYAVFCLKKKKKQTIARRSTTSTTPNSAILSSAAPTS